MYWNPRSHNECVCAETRLARVGLVGLSGMAVCDTRPREPLGP